MSRIWKAGRGKSGKRSGNLGVEDGFRWVDGGSVKRIRGTGELWQVSSSGDGLALPLPY